MHAPSDSVLVLRNFRFREKSNPGGANRKDGRHRAYPQVLYLLPTHEINTLHSINAKM